MSPLNSVILTVFLSTVVVLAPAPSAAGDSAGAPDRDLAAGAAALDQWLERQSQIRTWSADVLQIRTLKALSKPLQSRGHVWFEQPNRFRWELGEPPRTIAVRTGDELVVAYPRLGQVEHYAYGGQTDPALKQAMALLEVGLPSDPGAFHERYALLDARPADDDRDAWRFELQPKSEAARRLIERIVLETSAGDAHLAATELVFPDGSTMRNQFSHYRVDPKLPDDVFKAPDVKAQ